MNYGRMAKYTRMYHNSISATDVEKILFNPKDDKTMTVAGDRSTKWNVDANELTDASRFGVVTVYDNTYGYEDALKEVVTKMKTFYPTMDFHFDHTDHCDFCGQHIMYVALIVGVAKHDPNTLTFRSIGCDCLGKIFGTSWHGFRNAEAVKKSLVKAAAKRARKEKYPVKYATELKWLNSLPENLLRKKSFLVDMKGLILSGERVISKKMEDYLHRLMKLPAYDPKVAHATSEKMDANLAKVEMILNLIKEVDGDDIHSRRSAYNFVNDVASSCKQYGGSLTGNQMNALNKVYVRYSKLRVGVTVNSETLAAINAPATVGMPW